MKVKNSKTKNFLKYLALGGGVTILALSSPMLPLNLLKAYKRNKKFQKSIFLKDLRRLQERKLVDLVELADGSVKITLNDFGKEKNLHYKLDEMRIENPGKWDKKWRLVMFDIPHSKKQARDALRAKINQLGLCQLQKSVFIYPFPCEDEIDFVASLFDVRDNILFMIVDKFEGEEKLRHYFELD